MESGTITLSQRIGELPNTTAIRDVMKSFTHRLATYVGMQRYTTNSIMQLARNGFFLQKAPGSVSCAWCGYTRNITSWSSFECMNLQSQHWFGCSKKCNFLRERRPDRGYSDNRMDSFFNFLPCNQTPRQFVNAGFQYTGYDDSVKCRFCKVVVKYWMDCDVAFV